MSIYLDKNSKVIVQGITGAEGSYHTDRMLKYGTAIRRAMEAASTVQLDPSDISKARALAEKRGLDYQAYLQTLIHEALEREEKSAT